MAEEPIDPNLTIGLSFICAGALDDSP